MRLIFLFPCPSQMILVTRSSESIGCENSYGVAVSKALFLLKLFDSGQLHLIKRVLKFDCEFDRDRPHQLIKRNPHRRFVSIRLSRGSGFQVLSAVTIILKWEAFPIQIFLELYLFYFTVINKYLLAQTLH